MSVIMLLDMNVLANRGRLNMSTLITIQEQVINVHSNYCPGAGYKCAL